VSRPEWQKHINEEAGLLAEKGVDGFFLDNTDVYYLYPSADIFRGLVEIVDEIGQYKKDILINGGDVFVAEAILDAPTPLIQITGVNQECVFTGIDFDNNTTTSQSPEVSEYYQAYLERCKEAGLSVYLTEYGEDTESGSWEMLDEYCGKHQFTYFVSKSLSLQQNSPIAPITAPSGAVRARRSRLFQHVNTKYQTGGEA
jgi:endo-alpha-1,4-polygalactosaminidase (GH114 family)